MHTADVVGIIVGVVVIGATIWGVRAANNAMERQRAEYVQKRADFFAQMKRDKCLRTGFAGKYAEPIWTCPDGMAYKEP